MASSREIKMLTELLGLEGVKAVSRHQHKGIGIILEN
jgi:transposase